MNTKTTDTSEKKLRKSKVVMVTSTNIVLEGVTKLHLERNILTYEVIKDVTKKPPKFVSKKQIEKKVEPLCFDLVEVTEEELVTYRKSGVSSFVLKTDGKFYYSEIPDDIKFVNSNIIGIHKCAYGKNVCKRLSAASDIDGGCAKVREFKRGIESFSWITKGYETFNTKNDSFLVAKCLNYK